METQDPLSSANPNGQTLQAARPAPVDCEATTRTKTVANEALRSGGPAEAAAWASTLANGPLKDAAIDRIARDYGRTDPEAAVSGFAQGYAWQDPQAAIAWAEDISDPNLRQQSLTRAGQAYFRRDPASAKEWLANS